MLRYLCWRLLAILPLVLIISFIAFVLLNLAPSDPAEVALRVNEIVPTPEAIEGMRRELGLDKPFSHATFMAFSGISTGFWHLFFNPKTGDTRDVNCSPHALVSGYRIIIYAYYRVAFSLMVCGKTT